jgi:hypothetical protein
MLPEGIIGMPVGKFGAGLGEDGKMGTLEESRFRCIRSNHS